MSGREAVISGDGRDLMVTVPFQAGVREERTAEID